MNYQFYSFYRLTLPFCFLKTALPYLILVTNGERLFLKLKFFEQLKQKNVNVI